MLAARGYSTVTSTTDEVMPAPEGGVYKHIDHIHYVVQASISSAKNF